MEQTKLCLSEIAGANLKRLIKASKYKTQEKFAEAFNTNARCVGRWINDGITKTDLLQELAKMFGISAIEFLTPLD